MSAFKVGSVVTIGDRGTVGVVIKRKRKKRQAKVSYVNAVMHRAECYWFNFDALRAA